MLKAGSESVTHLVSSSGGGRPGRQPWPSGSQRRARATRGQAASPGTTSRRPCRRAILRTNSTTTPIKHVVVIFDENVSFDHYFGTYPFATNTDGTTFVAKPGTPTGERAVHQDHQERPGRTAADQQPERVQPAAADPREALTCDQNHDYTPEQHADDGGKMDKFVQYTQQDDCATTGEYYGPPGIVMDYYDGNTVTGLWNYAQNYAMSDNNWDTTFGPSTEGAIDVSSGLSPAVTRSTPSGTKTTDGGARSPRTAPSTATSTRSTTSARTPTTPPPTRRA